MSDTTADLPALPPPLANEDIRRALADVDARLSAWAAAIAGAQPAEAEQVAANPDQSPSPGPAATGVAEPAVAAEPPAKVVEPVHKVAEVLPEVAAATAKVAPPPAKAAPTPAKAASGSARAAPAAPTVKPEPPAAPSAAQRSSREEDEALLASLDPETAQAIKVMRRLSFENKSVRQLLEEYEQSRQSQDSSESRKKSWWSRG